MLTNYRVEHHTTLGRIYVPDPTPEQMEEVFSLLDENVTFINNCFWILRTACFALTIHGFVDLVVSPVHCIPVGKVEGNVIKLAIPLETCRILANLGHQSWVGGN